MRVAIAWSSLSERISWDHPRTPSPVSRPSRTRRSFEVICEQIREQLAASTFEAGNKLPAERTKRETSVEASYACAVEYYWALARATTNRIFVVSLSANLHEFVRWPDYETLQQSLIESRFKLVRHLQAKDKEAAVAEMRKHLQRVHRHVRKNSEAVATG